MLYYGNKSMEDISYSGVKPPIWKRFSRKTVLIIIFIIIVLGLLGSLFYFVTRDAPKEQVTKTIELPEENVPETPEITEDPQEEVEETPTPVVIETEKGDIKISVQNGSGESGVAGDAADILRDAGYDVISTGNADNFEYENVTIQVKASVDALEFIEEDLSGSYTIGVTSTDLSEDESFDALVIIGI